VAQSVLVVFRTGQQQLGRNPANFTERVKVASKSSRIFTLAARQNLLGKHVSFSSAICSFDLGYKYSPNFSSTNELLPHNTFVFRTQHDPKSSTYENTIVVASYHLRYIFKNNSSYCKTSSSTMRASILIAGLSALAFKALAQDTLTDTLSTTTTVTILSCHPVCKQFGLCHLIFRTLLT